jgi:hypothetical protein
MYLSIYLSMYLSIYQSIHLSIYRRIFLSIYLSVVLFIWLSRYLSIDPSIGYLAIKRSMHPSFYISIIARSRGTGTTWCASKPGAGASCFVKRRMMPARAPARDAKEGLHAVAVADSGPPGAGKAWKWRRRSSSGVLSMRSQLGCHYGRTNGNPDGRRLMDLMDRLMNAWMHGCMDAWMGGKIRIEFKRKRGCGGIGRVLGVCTQERAREEEVRYKQQLTALTNERARLSALVTEHRRLRCGRALPTRLQ